MYVERASIFCIRYMPTLRPPVCGSFVITAGSVMNGAGSPGQQRWIGSRSRSTSSPVEHDLLARRRGGRSSAASRRSTSASSGRAPCRRAPAAAASRARPRAWRATSSSRSTPNARHMRRSVPNWLIRSGCREPFGLLEQERRAAGLDGAVDDLGDLEVRVDLGGDANELALALEQRESTRGGRQAGPSARQSR